MDDFLAIQLDSFAESQQSGNSSSISIRLARSFTWAVVTAYWNQINKGQLSGICNPAQFGVPQSDVKCSKALIDQATQYAESLVGLDPIDASFIVGQLFTKLLPSEYRAQNGIYFTPPGLTNRLLDLCESAGIQWSTAKVLDPACGGGAFLGPVIARKRNALQGRPAKKVFEIIIGTVRGYELDPFSAWLSQMFADITAFDVCLKVGQRLPRIVDVKDSLKPIQGKVSVFDLVIGNPPYSRTKLADDRRAYYGRSLYGHANLYGLFTDQALRLCAKDGVIAFVTPTSFLGGEYFKRLRHLLRTDAYPLNVEFISDREGVFEDVLQETMLATYRTSGPNGSISVGILHTDGRRTKKQQNLGRFLLPENREEPWLLPRTSSQAALMREASQLPYRLKDYGYAVSTGPLVWNRHKDQLANEPGEGRYPLIWAEAVTADGRFNFKAERRNHAPYFKARLPRDNWLLVTKPCILLHRTTAKEQPRRLILARLSDSFLKKHGAVIVENHLNMLRPFVDKPTFSIEVIESILNSRLADDMFRCINGSVAVSAYELEALPLPAPACLRELEKLLAHGASKEAIERAIERGYLHVRDAAVA